MKDRIVIAGYAIISKEKLPESLLARAERMVREIPITDWKRLFADKIDVFDEHRLGSSLDKDQQKPVIDDIVKVLRPIWKLLYPRSEANDWSALWSKPGGKRQAPHTDYEFPNDFEHISHETVPAALLIALQDGTKIHTYGWNRRVVVEEEEEVITLNRGNVAILRGDLIHAGAPYTVDNIRLHAYLDVDGDSRFRKKKVDKPIQPQKGRGKKKKADAQDELEAATHIVPVLDVPDGLTFYRVKKKKVFICPFCGKEGSEGTIRRCINRTHGFRVSKIGDNEEEVKAKRLKGAKEIRRTESKLESGDESDEDSEDHESEDESDADHGPPVKPPGKRKSVSKRPLRARADDVEGDASEDEPDADHGPPVKPPGKRKSVSKRPLRARADDVEADASEDKAKRPRQKSVTRLKATGNPTKRKIVEDDEAGDEHDSPVTRPKKRHRDASPPEIQPSDLAGPHATIAGASSSSGSDGQATPKAKGLKRREKTHSRMHVATKDKDSSVAVASATAPVVRLEGEGEGTGQAEEVEGAAEETQEAAEEVQDAAEGVQDAAAETQEAAEVVQEAAVEVHDAAEETQDAAEGTQDAAEEVQDAAEGVQDAAAETQDAAEEVQDAAEVLLDVASTAGAAADAADIDSTSTIPTVVDK